MTKFFKQGENIYVGDAPARTIHEQLPSGYYSISYHPKDGYYFTEIDAFTFPEKTYGKVGEYTELFINTFLHRPASTGILLEGLKGSGKTLQSKILSRELNNRYSIPTVCINQAHHGEDFNRFIQSLEQPILFLFDEFEKVYDPDFNNAQRELLTLLDGTFPTKKLFVFTSNDIGKIDERLLNRPGRVFYRIKYEGLSDDSIKEYIEDNLKNKDFADELYRISSGFAEISFDMLKAVIEEVNRYNIRPMDAIKPMNITSSFGEVKRYVVDIVNLEKESTCSSDDYSMTLNVMKPFAVPFTETHGLGRSEYPIPHEKIIRSSIGGTVVNTSNAVLMLDPTKCTVSNIRKGYHVFEHAGYKVVLSSGNQPSDESVSAF